MIAPGAVGFAANFLKTGANEGSFDVDRRRCDRGYVPASAAPGRLLSGDLPVRRARSRPHALAAHRGATHLVPRRQQGAK